MKKLLLLVMAVVLVGCETLDVAEESKKFESWVGAPEDELILKWGAPSRRAKDGKGGHVLVWDSGKDFGEVQWKKKAEFWVDATGKVYHWRWSDGYHEKGASRETKANKP